LLSFSSFVWHSRFQKWCWIRLMRASECG
jgi:hypothetical protein